jgi:O-antigen ligase
VIANKRSSNTATTLASEVPVRGAAMPAFHLIAFLAAHIVVGAAIRFVPQLSTLYSLAFVGFGVLVAATTKRPQQVAYLLAYLAGVEVLWRMSKAVVFYEIGKYAAALIIFVVLVRFRARTNKATAIAYFACLLPSALLTIFALSPDEARQQLSFNLSGPLALALCIVYFSNIRLSALDVRRLLVCLIAPIIAVSVFVYLSTAAVENLEFASSISNVATSGGYGPNQVSAILGLGLLFAVLLLFERDLSWGIRLCLILIATVFAVQAALTFSRGGLFLALLSGFAAALYLVRNAKTRISLLLLGGLFFGMGKYIVVPRLEEFTSGKLSERYASIDPSGRGLLAGFDIAIFTEHPVLGVGPGVAPEMRRDLGHFGAAHTEYTRLLAEHGLLGIIAIILLLWIGWQTFSRARGLIPRAYVVSLLLWVSMFFAINAMRMLAPAVLFGLACALSQSSRAVSRAGVRDAV